MHFMLARRSILAIFIIIGLSTVVGLVILSPLGLAGIAHFRNDWLQLSDIGQTYGAVSAILSGLALVGIIASLQYQARDSRNAHEQMMRTFQFELIKLELDDPSLIAATGAPWGRNIPSDVASLREFLYVQMWVSFWASIYATGGMRASVVRSLASDEIFKGEAARTYWSAVGQQQLATSKGRYNQFFRLLDEEYNKAISSGIHVAGPVMVASASVLSNEITSRKVSDLLKKLSVVLVGAILGVLADRHLRQKRRRLMTASLSCGAMAVECALSAVGKAWLDGHCHKADIAGLGVVEVVHAPVLRPQPLDNLRHCLVDGLIPRRGPLSDCPGCKWVSAAT